MSSEKDADPEPESTNSPSIFRRLRELIPFGRAPETTEALEHEIQELLEEGEEHGLITPLEEKMISSIFDFRDTLTSEVMTPVSEICSFEASAPVSEIIKGVIEEGYTRFPIYRERSDRIIGIIHARDLLRMCAMGANGSDDLEKFLMTPTFVPENKPIVDLLLEFQKQKSHMAIVMDEFGAVRGLITLEDILEEIVGEIEDEYDIDGEDDFEEIDEQAALVSGKVDIEDVEERLGMMFPEGPYESIGGYVIHQLGRLGAEGDRVEVDGHTLVVQVAGKRRIKKVKIIRDTVGADS
jgi:CBS domain containing-hemolysin-like protein